MARLPRIVLPGIPHHVTQRGNRRERTFFEDGDYELYLDLLADAAGRAGVEAGSPIRRRPPDPSRCAGPPALALVEREGRPGSALLLRRGLVVEVHRRAVGRAGADDAAVGRPGRAGAAARRRRRADAQTHEGC